MFILDLFMFLFSTSRNQIKGSEHCLQGIFPVAHKESKVNSFVKAFHYPNPVNKDLVPQEPLTFISKGKLTWLFLVA